MNENRLAAARRVVIKIGSSLLTEAGNGSLREDWLAALAEDLAAWRARRREVVVVSSGAIAVGRRALGITGATLKLEEKQACAAVGQIRLAHAYQAALDRHGITVAQVLLTLEDSEHRRRYLNARSTIDQLLGMDALPLINENDTVATAEIRFGDNDRLAARVAQMASADVLVLLSDIDGLYTADPARDTGAERLEEITAITPEIEAMAGGSRNYEGSGGMITKLAAARITTGAGCHMVITKGAANHCLRDLEQGAACTWFVAAGEPRTARKHWIAGTLQPQGALVVDDGAA
ncbi:MAG TPA: glutamate 5-kinase, partial [Alphaproteobacteria bacterium]|nr:glutamate 5-kinase [Alphaproteobacteria bacterium]